MAFTYYTPTFMVNRVSDGDEEAEPDEDYNDPPDVWVSNAMQSKEIYFASIIRESSRGFLDPEL